MSTLLVAGTAMAVFGLAYAFYGRWLARRVFRLDPEAPVPARVLCDGVDYVPTRREIVFGHHFTSIAGTGPIVGPAIAVFWGWLPALLWVVVGAVFIGAVHDFGALVVSLRHRGETVGQIAGRVIHPRARVLFLAILFFALMIVLAIFGLVIATIFATYPEVVLSVWIEIPLAIAIGLWIHRRGGSLLLPSLAALATMYFAIYFGVYYLPVRLDPKVGLFANPTLFWTAVLFVYCFIASVLPVWVLLQPRDYINSHELLVALGLLLVGLAAAGLSGRADLAASAPAVAAARTLPADAPPIWPFLFITIACGAVSGFHCLVSSGTSSKQLESETDALAVGYGAMLLEGGLAVIVICACCAGVGMGVFRPVRSEQGTIERYVQVEENGQPVTGRAAWETRYGGKSWKAFGLIDKVGAFIEGGANFLRILGIPLELGIGIIAVLVASFAATTLDTATRLQRYVVQELAGMARVRPLANKYAATAFALGTALLVALLKKNPDAARGTGGLLLWPLFGATNQMLAGLALLVIVFYLRRTGRPYVFALPPLLIMTVVPVWALSYRLAHPAHGFWASGNILLGIIGTATLLLQIWLVVEAVRVWRRLECELEGNDPQLRVSSEVTPPC